METWQPFFFFQATTLLFGINFWHRCQWNVLFRMYDCKSFCAWNCSSKNLFGVWSVECPLTANQWAYSVHECYTYLKPVRNFNEIQPTVCGLKECSGQWRFLIMITLRKWEERPATRRLKESTFHPRFISNRSSCTSRKKEIELVCPNCTTGTATDDALGGKMLWSIIIDKEDSSPPIELSRAGSGELRPAVGLYFSRRLVGDLSW